MVSPANLCIICKGRNLCGNSICPLIPRFRASKTKYSKEISAPSHNIFVGRSGYPNVHLGPLTSTSENKSIDSPSEWFGIPYDNIVELRSSIIRSKQPVNIKQKSKFIEENQLLATASKPTNIELVFKKEPIYFMKFSDITQPMGPSADIQSMHITENVKIARRVDQIVNDELKATESANMLYASGEDVYKITTIFSSGAIGIEKNKKLVPTRWSIASIDDILAKHLIAEIKQYPSIGEFHVYSSEYLGNHFEILLMPGNWEFENFEAWSPGSMWMRNAKEPEIIEEYESNKGRKTYAELQGGGYYCSRLAISEHLSHIKRQCKVIAFREVYESYIIPLGCWVIRETVRNAFKQPANKFPSLNQAISHISTKLRLPIEEYIKRSKILNQKRLWDF